VRRPPRGKLLAAAVLLGGAGPALAGPEGYLDLFYVPSAEIEIVVPGFGSGEDDGDGFGVRGQAPATDYLYFLGEYQVRMGLGFAGDGGGGAIVEYVSLEEGVEADGIGVHLRAGGAHFYTQIGYLMLSDDFEDITGPEFAVGLVFTGGGSDTGVFIDVRHAALEGEDSGVEVDLTDFRAGVRIGF
jgi:hypothetical protein